MTTSDYSKKMRVEIFILNTAVSLHSSWRTDVFYGNEEVEFMQPLNSMTCSGLPIFDLVTTVTICSNSVG